MRLKRRQFLMLSSLFGVSSCVWGEEMTQFEKNFQVVKPLIEAVQNHMFPSESKIPSSKKTNAISFLFETVAHPSFDKDIRKFVIEGALELDSRTKNTFLSMNQKSREKFLRAYEQTEYGNSWLSRIMTLTMEGMFSDPIYGSNIKEIGWKALNAYGGEPRPKRKYLDV